MPAAVKVVAMTVTLLPLGVIGLMGIGGDSLMQFAVSMVKYFAHRRKLHFRRIDDRNDKKKTKAPRKRRKK